MEPHEIQVGILKRLRGTPIIRHSDKYNMRYSPTAPYEILSNNIIDFSTMQMLKRFARYWDMIANSGRFKYTKAFILGDKPFENFLNLSNWIHSETDQTHQIALPRLFTLLKTAMTEVLNLDTLQTDEYLMKDFIDSGIKGQPKFLQQNITDNKKTLKRRSESRQKRHQIND